MRIERLRPHISSYLKVLYAVIFIFTTAACNADLVFEKNQNIPGDAWSRHFIPVFELEVADTLNPHDLMINLRNTGQYPKSNLFLFISATSPTGAFTRDTLELVLAGPSGRWNGKGFGNVWQNRFFYRQNVRFPEKGKYVFRIEQAMRIDELPGILDVGLRVEKKQL